MLHQTQEELFEEEEIHLRDYLRVLSKRKYIIGLVFLLTMLLVVLFTARTVPIYEAASQVLVEKNEGTALVGQMVRSGYDPEFYETQRQIILSQNVARKVVSILDLERKWKIYFPKKRNGTTLIGSIKQWIMSFLPQKAEGEIKGSPIPTVPASEADLIADKLRKKIRVTPVKKSRIMNISFQSTNPDFSRLVANTIAGAYKEEVMAIQMDSSSYALKWMTIKAEEQRKKLAQAERALQQYMKRHDIVTVEDKVAVLPQQLSDLTARLAEAEAQKDVASNIYNQVIELKESKGDVDTLPAVAANVEIQSIRASIRVAEQNINELKKKYGYKHPVMIEAKSKYNELQRQKANTITKIIGSIKNEYDVAAAQEASLRSSLSKIKGSTMAMNEKMTEYNVLKRDVDTIKALYDSLILKAKEKGVTENTQKVNVWVTQVAQTPENAIKPRPVRNILLGIILGLSGGIGCAFFIEYLDNTVKEPEDTERKLGISVIGVVEKIKKDQDSDTLALEEPSSSYSESFKSLRTSVLLSSAEQPPKKIMITSMSPQEGKTTTSLNLAYAMAKMDKNILLIDADQRRPRVHKAFSLENKDGLSSYLSGSTDIPKINATDIPYLFVMTSGPIPPNPSELVGSGRFIEMLSNLEQKYDMIIIDTPPTMSATDSLLIGKAVDGVIIVCLSGAITYDRVQHGLKSLQNAQANILGITINSVDMKKSNYYSYYGYYQYTSSKEA